ncbi:MAG: carbohydrate kinase [Hamadaea sp.]|nr:carbohydrate kinase [Hamadaea sp.]
MPPSAVVLGEALIDLLEQPDGTFRPAVGGAPLNVAVGLARLGTPARLVTALGSDTFADRVRDLLASAGVDRHGLLRVSGPSPLAVATFSGAEPGFAFYGDPPAYAHVRPADVDLAAVAAATAVYAGSIALLSEFVDAARAAWAVPGPLRFFDPNLRPFTLTAPGAADRARAVVEEFAATADLVKLSDVDAELLYGRIPPTAAALRLRSLGARRIVVTLGAAGAILVGPDRGLRPVELVDTAIHRTDAVVGLPAHPGPVVDTTGCGDAVAAALIHRLVGGLETEQDWIAAVEFALRVASFVAARPGGAVAMPSVTDLAA